MVTQPLGNPVYRDSFIRKSLKPQNTFSGAWVQLSICNVNLVFSITKYPCQGLNTMVGTMAALLGGLETTQCQYQGLTKFSAENLLDFKTI